MSDTIKKHVKDPGSAITHFIGMLMAVFAAVPLIIKATHEPSPIYVVSIAIYALFYYMQQVRPIILSTGQKRLIQFSKKSII